MSLGLNTDEVVIPDAGAQINVGDAWFVTLNQQSVFDTLACPTYTIRGISLVFKGLRLCLSPRLVAAWGCGEVSTNALV